MIYLRFGTFKKFGNKYSTLSGLPDIYDDMNPDAVPRAGIYFPSGELERIKYYYAKNSLKEKNILAQDNALGKMMS